MTCLYIQSEPEDLEAVGQGSEVPQPVDAPQQPVSVDSERPIVQSVDVSQQLACTDLAMLVTQPAAASHDQDQLPDQDQDQLPQS